MLVGAWEFERSYRDNSGASNHGTIAGNPLAWAIPQQGHGVQLSGNAYSHIIPGSRLFPLGSSPRTTIIRFRLRSNTDQALFCYGSNGLGLRWNIGYCATQQRLVFEGGSIASGCAHAIDYKPHHLAVILPRDKSHASELLYVLDGRLVPTITIADGILNTTAELPAFGVIKCAGIWASDAEIFSCYHFNEALSVANVQRIMQRGLGSSFPRLAYQSQVDTFNPYYYNLLLRRAA